MTTGIFIAARLGSSRLQRKHLLEVNGLPIFHYLLRRIITGFAAEIAAAEVRVFITTSEEEENRELKRFEPLGLAVFFGAPHNIPYRYLQCAAANGIDHIVSVDGDDILCSVTAMKEVQRALRNGARYAATAGLPLGLNASGFSHDFLKEAVARRAGNILETGWGRIFSPAEPVKIPLSLPQPQDERLRFTLDYDEDFQFFKNIIEWFGDGILTLADWELVEYVRRHEVYRLNEAACARYWRNFRETMALEQKQDTAAE